MSTKLGYGMGSVDQLPSGSWRWRGRLRGENATLTEPTESAVIAAAMAALNSKPIAPGAPRPTSKVTLALAAEAWRNVAVVSLKGAQCKKLRWTIKVICRDLGGTAAIAEITRADVRTVLATWTKQYATDSIRQLYSSLGRIFEFAVDAEWIPTSPVPDRPNVGKAQPGREVVFLHSVAEAEQLRAYLRDNHSTANTLFLSMLLTGMRPGEAKALQWDVFDWTSTPVYAHVRRSIEMGGNGNAELLSDDVKTSQHGDEGKRWLALPADLVAAIRRERDAQHARGQLTPFVFANHRTGGFLTSKALKVALRKINAASGTTPMTPYGYRHTFLSILADSQLLPLAAQKQVAGHKSTSNVINRYTHNLRGQRVDTTPAVGGTVTPIRPEV